MIDIRMYSLVHKELTDQLSADEVLELSQLRGNHPAESISQEIATIWSASKEFLPQRDWKKADAKTALLQRIRTETIAQPSAVANSSSNYRYFAIGAVIAILGLAALYFWNSADTSVDVEIPTQTIEYAMLDDDTKMWVGAGSEVTVASFSPSERKVNLEGEAIFDVTRDETRPFTIDLGNDVYAQVLGTSFKATSTHDGALGSIAVREGKVRLYSTSLEGFDMVLTAGDFGSIDPALKAQKRQKVTTPIVLETQKDISFNNTPIADVFSSLSDHFGVEIQVNGDMNCPHTSPLVKNSSLSQVFEVISAAHDGLTIVESARSTYVVTGTCELN